MKMVVDFNTDEGRILGALAGLGGMAIGITTQEQVMEFADLVYATETRFGLGAIRKVSLALLAEAASVLGPTTDEG